MRDKLPKKFVVKTDTSNELWGKFEQYLNMQTDRIGIIKFDLYKYYGLELRDKLDWVIGFNYEFDIITYECPIITLEEWHSIVYPEYQICYVADKPSEDIYFNTIQQAIQTYGIDKQVDMWFEESSELTKALCKYRRNPNEKTLADVREEIEDAGIMIDQLRLMFSEPENSYDIKHEKVQRLYSRLNPSSNDPKR